MGGSDGGIRLARRAAYYNLEEYSDEEHEILTSTLLKKRTCNSNLAVNTFS
jgi:hypothetical protein